MRMQNREGFALPVAIFVIGFLTVGVAAAFTRVDNEVRVNRDRDAEVDAFALAQSGLDYFMSNRKALGLTAMPPAAAESARVTLTGGYADVVLTRVRQQSSTIEALYYIRSRGVATQGATAATPPARRIVAQSALFRRADMQVRAAWTSLTGLTKNGGAGSITGVDGCGLMPSVAGVSVPDNTGSIGGYIQNGGAPVPDGNPPVEYMGTQAQMSDSVRIDWDGILNDNVLPPDVVVPTDPWPSFADPNYWPVTRVNGNYSIPTSGRGLLIVTGDLTVGGSLTWDGVLLVGGTLTSDGTNNIRGATISGLNVKLDPPVYVPRSDVGNGTKTFQYNSCAIAAALNAAGALYAIPGTWTDNYPSW